MDNISERLSAYRKRANVKMKVIAEATNIPIENLYKWAQGHKPGNAHDYNKLKAYLDAMENKPVEEASPVYITQPPATMHLPLNPQAPATAQTSGKAASGTIVVNNDQPELIVDRIDAPFLGEVEGVVEMAGESMEPTFINGSRIAITRLKNPAILDWGECYYIINKNWLGLVRRIYFESVDSLRLVSDYIDQKKYPPIIRYWNEIEAIFKIKAVIQKY